MVVLTGGERHERPVLPLLMERGAVKRAGRGRPRIRPDAVAGDKGYSSPTKADEATDPAFDRAAYRERNVSGRAINRLKRWRRVATRSEKRAANYRAMLTLAAILLWL